MKFNPAEKIDDQTALSIIREIVTNGTVEMSSHAKNQLGLRGYTTNDVMYILLYGLITNSTFKEENNNWVYIVEGDDLDGDRGSVVIAITKRMFGVVITVLS